MKMKIKINYLYLVYFLLFFILFEPGYFTQFPFVHSIYIAGKVVCFIIVTIDIVLQKHITKFMLITMLYLIVQLLSTVLNEGNIWNALYEIVITIGGVGVVYKMVRKYGDKSLNAFLLVFEFLIYGNFFSVLIAPNGLYVIEQDSGWWTNMCWFMGLRNGMTVSYVLAAFFELAYYYKNREKSILVLLRCTVFFSLATITIFKISSVVTQRGQATTSGGLILTWLIILLYFIAVKFDTLLGWFDFSKGVIINYILMFILVFCRLQYLFSYIIIGLLKKDLTLTSRTMIWDKAIELMKSNWLFGYGLPKGDSMAILLDNSAAVNTTQNGFLDVFFFGGIILSLVLVMLFKEVGKRIKLLKLDCHYNFFFGYFIAVFLLAIQGESTGGLRLFVMLSAIYYMSPLFTEKSLILLVDDYKFHSRIRLSKKVN